MSDGQDTEEVANLQRAETAVITSEKWNSRAGLPRWNSVIVSPSERFLELMLTDWYPKKKILKKKRCRTAKNSTAQGGSGGTGSAPSEKTETASSITQGGPEESPILRVSEAPEVDRSMCEDKASCHAPKAGDATSQGPQSDAAKLMPMPMGGLPMPPLLPTVGGAKFASPMQQNLRTRSPAAGLVPAKSGGRLVSPLVRPVPSQRSPPPTMGQLTNHWVFPSTAAAPVNNCPIPSASSAPVTGVVNTPINTTTPRPQVTPKMRAVSTSILRPAQPDTKFTIPPSTQPPSSRLATTCAPWTTILGMPLGSNVVHHVGPAQPMVQTQPLAVPGTFTGGHGQYAAAPIQIAQPVMLQSSPHTSRSMPVTWNVPQPKLIRPAFFPSHPGTLQRPAPLQIPNVTYAARSINIPGFAGAGQGPMQVSTSRTISPFAFGAPRVSLQVPPQGRVNFQIPTMPMQQNQLSRLQPQGSSAYLHSATKTNRGTAPVVTN